MTYEESIVKNITTNRTTRPDVPQTTIRNPIDEDVFVNLIEILPDVEFAQKGKLVILINGSSVIDETSDSFRQFSKFPIPLGKKLLRNFKVEILAWNGTDTNELKCDFNIHLSSEQKQIPSVATPLTQDQRNAAISNNIASFQLSPRQPNTTESILLHLQGYRKILILISSSTANLPTPIVGNGNIADGDLLTMGTEEQVTDTVNFAHAQTVDFGSIANRLAAAKFRVSQDFGATVTPRLETSDDGAAWAVAITGGGVSGVGDYYLADTIIRSFRFLRVTFKRTGINAIYRRVYEVYDKNTVGGTGSLSFEVLDTESGEWIEYVSASEIGSITGGGSLKKLIGDVTEEGTDRFNRSLPQTQSRFRVKYSIDNNGALTNSISILGMQ